jgi:hypothetical protein
VDAVRQLRLHARPPHDERREHARPAAGRGGVERRPRRSRPGSTPTSPA